MTQSDPYPEFQRFRDKMTAEGLPPVVIDTFAYYYNLLRSGETGMISAADIEPADNVPDFDQLKGMEPAGQEALGKAVVIKLNGGLGTSMGMRYAKSLVPAKDGLTFLDIIVRQVLALRQGYQCRLPLLFMNSFSTNDDTRLALAKYPDLEVGVPLDFLQHKVPRILQEDFTPLAWPEDPQQEWCPPGHGDIYTALQTSGMLAKLLHGGFQYAFISNSDNLGAVMDLGLLGWFAKKRLPFLMEVAQRTEADKKGGHLARLKNGGFTLRESAQCPEEEKTDFQDISRHRFFNTNNLWVNLETLDRFLKANQGIMKLPMICNAKKVGEQAVYQMETAMGAALSVIEGAGAMLVPRTRFAPVKTTNDLLMVWSDHLKLTQDFRVEQVDPAGLRKLVVDLDPEFYKEYGAFVERFPHGAPSLLACSRLQVHGDVRFGKGVVLKGHVTLTAESKEPRRIADGETVVGETVVG